MSPLEISSPLESFYEKNIIKQFIQNDKKVRFKRRKPMNIEYMKTAIEDEPNNVPSKGWAEMIRKVYEVNPLLCPRCRFSSH